MTSSNITLSIFTSGRFSHCFYIGHCFVRSHDYLFFASKSVLALSSFFLLLNKEIFRGVDSYIVISIYFCLLSWFVISHCFVVSACFICCWAVIIFYLKDCIIVSFSPTLLEYNLNWDTIYFFNTHPLCPLHLLFVIFSIIFTVTASSITTEFFIAFAQTLISIDPKRVSTCRKISAKIILANLVKKKSSNKAAPKIRKFLR